MYTNSTITLYRLINGAYERSGLSAFYNSTQISTFNKTGNTTSDTITVFIPYVEQLKKLKFTTGKDYIVKGLCDISIDCTTDKALSDSLKLLKTHDFVTIMSADTKTYGSQSMWHYQLSCR